MCLRMSLSPQAVRLHAVTSVYQRPISLSARFLVQMELPLPRPGSLTQRAVSGHLHWLAMRRCMVMSMHQHRLWLSTLSLVQMELPPRRLASLNQLAVSGQALPHWRAGSLPSCGTT